MASWLSARGLPEGRRLYRRGLAARGPRRQAAPRRRSTRCLATASDAGLAGVASLLLEAVGVRAEDVEADSSHVSELGLGAPGLSRLAAAGDRGDLGIVRALVGSGKVDVNFAATEDAASRSCRLPTEAMHVCSVSRGPPGGAGDRRERRRTAAATARSPAPLPTDPVTSSSSLPCWKQTVSTSTSRALWAAHVPWRWLRNVATQHASPPFFAAKGVDVNLTSWLHGDNAGTRTAADNNVGAVCALVAVGSLDVNHACKAGHTALHHAASNTDSMECARVLLAAKGLGHGRADYMNQTALHCACRHKNADMVSLLLIGGSCRFAQCSAHEGAGVPLTETPLALAEEHEEVRAVFVSGVDCRHRTRHGGHTWATWQVVLAVMLARQRQQSPCEPQPATLPPMRSCTCRGGSG